MLSPTELSDVEEDSLSNDINDVNNEGGHASDEAIEDSNDQGKKVDPSKSQKRTVRNPQPKLDAERLKGPKGLHTIEECFSDFKFHGKGYERSDLNRLMKKLEYWSHRLFPKYEFDDCLAKLETLGHKKPVQTHLTKIRLGLTNNDDDMVLNDNANENEEIIEDSEPIDAFDALIFEELKKHQSSTTPQQPFVPTNSDQTPSRSSNVPEQTSSTATETVGVSSNIEITTEMRERMERNKQLAIQKRLARIEAEEARKKSLQQQSEEENLMPGVQESDEQMLPKENVEELIEK